MTTENKTTYFGNRRDWRQWLADNFDTANEIWFVFPLRLEEFEKRLNHFINKTKENKQIRGFGGIEKYY